MDTHGHQSETYAPNAGVPVQGLPCHLAALVSSFKRPVKGDHGCRRGSLAIKFGDRTDAEGVRKQQSNDCPDDPGRTGLFLSRFGVVGFGRLDLRLCIAHEASIAECRVGYERNVKSLTGPLSRDLEVDRDAPHEGYVVQQCIAQWRAPRAQASQRGVNGVHRGSCRGGFCFQPSRRPRAEKVDKRQAKKPEDHASVAARIGLAKGFCEMMLRFGFNHGDSMALGRRLWVIENLRGIIEDIEGRIGGGKNL